MLDSLLQTDKEILIYLNNLGSSNFDGFWLAITNQFNWSPLFVLLIFLSFYKLGAKKGLFTLIFIVLLVAFSDQFTNLVKNATERLRPCNTLELKGLLRDFTYKPKGYSFWSGHASLSMTVTVFLVSLLRDRFTWIYLLFIFPLLFGYSRIYLGVHYPFDVLSGYVSGLVIGTLLFMLYKYLFSFVFREK